MNALLALASVLVGLALCEGALRLFAPRYEHLAAPPRAALDPSEVLHPDSGEPHAVIYNNLGSRQHRHFTEQDLADAVNLAFFGDSFTENLRMAAHYQFAEVLDFLLNAHPHGDVGAAPQGRRFNVLNFGVEGTGIGEQYARYRSLSFKPRFRHVFYVHHHNDVAELRRAAGWVLNDSDELVRQVLRPTPAWRRVLAQLHLTYLVVDVASRQPAREAVVLSWGEMPALFEALLLRWREEVEADGGTFHIVLLPMPRGDSWMRGKADAGWPVVNLYPCFRMSGASPADWRFERDSHWNEAGNMLAAQCLYRHLETTLDLPVRSDRDIARLRRAYYAAFWNSSAWYGHRWMPGRPWALAGATTDEDAARRIVARYQALGGAASRRERVVKAVGAREPVLRSVWNVHLGREERSLVYVKEPCDEDDPAAGLFLRWRPWNPADIDRDERLAGYAERRRVAAARRVGSRCVLVDTLPEAPVASVHTGQRAATGEVLWEGEFAVDDADAYAAVLAAHRRKYEAVVATAPAARAAWNLHRLPATREIVYVKAPCHVNDTIGSFSLRVRPAEPAALAGRDGRDTLLEIPIKFKRAAPRKGLWRKPFRPRPWPRRSATVFDGKCMMTATLPQWWVGQVFASAYTADGDLLWETSFYFDTDRLRRAWRRAVEREPDASGAFDVYRRGRTLTYVREPCAADDIRDRFFLHVFPSRRPAGAFDNLDFDFPERGARIDGRCVAQAWLPEHVRNVRTGQAAPDSEPAWEVEIGLSVVP